MPVYYLMLGAPGAGKGTQAKRLSDKIKLSHISSGDIFRDHLKRDTELGKLARDFMSRGELVPDDITIAMIRERLLQSDCADGAVLDGFPRTPAQAKHLETLIAELNGRVAKAIYIRVAKETLIKRLSGRWMCRLHGHVYHDIHNPPKTPGVCDIDGSELYQRDDDKAETVAHRINVYLEQTAPLIDYYRDRNYLIEINGEQSIDAVSSDLLAKLKQG